MRLNLSPSTIQNYVLLLFFCLFNIHLFAQTTVAKKGKKWNLLVDGKPFEVKGATFGYGDDVENYDKYFADLQFMGVNTIRTWATGKNTPQLLDAAKRHDIKVMVGIWMRHGRPGMEDDDSFNYLKDKQGMEAMYTGALETVELYKDHPAVLTWGIGNEVYLNTATDEEKLAYSKLLEKICAKIKELDANHPITSVEAWTFGLDWWQKHVPSLDIYGLNSYGAGAGYLAVELEKKNIDKPYIITEFGVTGEWDIKAKKNDIVIEPTDAQKYDAIAKGYPDWIKSKVNCLGVYVFHYANGDNFVSRWLFTHNQGSYRPAYWAIREAFTGKKSLNFIPKIEEFGLPEEAKASGTWIPVALKVTDTDSDIVDCTFTYNQRTGSRKRRDQVVKLNVRGNLSEGFEIQLPKESGAIKIYAEVKDDYNNLAVASTSIVVKNAEKAEKKYLVPHVKLPFYVYQDGEKEPYFPTAYMGNHQAIKVDMQNTEEVYAGNHSVKISYAAEGNWYGVGFVDPANDWGDILGGYDISGAETFSFWAKASRPKLTATIGFGLIGKDKPFPDTAKKSVEIKLGTKWKKYTIKLKKLDMSCIRSGLVLFSAAYGTAQDIWIDEVVFEQKLKK